MLSRFDVPNFVQMRIEFRSQVDNWVASRDLWISSLNILKAKTERVALLLSVKGGGSIETFAVVVEYTEAGDVFQRMDVYKLLRNNVGVPILPDYRHPHIEVFLESNILYCGFTTNSHFVRVSNKSNNIAPYTGMIKKISEIFNSPVFSTT